MKAKIFNYGLLAAVAMLAISATVSAQDLLAVPPMPPKVYTFKPDKAFKQNMANLKVKMKQLQRQMEQSNVKMKLDKDLKFAFKDFDLNFNDSFKDLGQEFSEGFKDLGKEFSGSYNEIAPDVSVDLKGLNGNDNEINNKEYRKKLADGQMIERVKNYSKTYSVNATDILQINNSFGKVVVNTWAKDEFKVDVQMKFSADDEDFVTNMINGSSITDSKVGPVVSFNTNLARNFNNHGDTNIDVNYTVYMPAGNALNLTNKFGNVTLPDLNGKVTLRVSYGKLIAQQLTNTENDVQIKFAQDGKSTIALLNGGKLKLDYGSLKAGIFNNVDVNMSFSDLNLDKLKNAATFRIKYGNGVTVGIIDRSVRTINVNASFTKFKIDFKEADSFNFDVVTKLGDFNYNDDNVKVTAKTPSDDEHGWSSSKSYKGYIGKNNSNGKIIINASYTSVDFQ
jgi:hypothetical protein